MLRTHRHRHPHHYGWNEAEPHKGTLSDDIEAMYQNVCRVTAFAVVLGGQEVGVLTLLEMIVKWLDSEQPGLSAFLQHVHFDSCKALIGVSNADKQRHATIKHIALSGFTVNSGVQAAQVLAWGNRFWQPSQKRSREAHHGTNMD